MVTLVASAEREELLISFVQVCCADTNAVAVSLSLADSFCDWTVPSSRSSLLHVASSNLATAALHFRASSRRWWHLWTWMATAALMHSPCNRSRVEPAPFFIGLQGMISHKEMKAILEDKDAVRALHSASLLIFMM